MILRKPADLACGWEERPRSRAPGRRRTCRLPRMQPAGKAPFSINLSRMRETSIRSPPGAGIPYARRFAEMVPLRKGLRLLDVGCGTGQSRQIYADKKPHFVGMDLSAEALRVAAARFSNDTWLWGDACEMPFDDGQFNVVCFSAVLHHIAEFPRAVREGFRVLRPGGYVFAFDPNLLHPAMAIFRHPKSWFYSSRGVSANERPLLPSALRAAFQAAGLTEIRQRCQADLPYRKVAYPVTQLAAQRLWLRGLALGAIGLGTLVRRLDDHDRQEAERARGPPSLARRASGGYRSSPLRENATGGQYLASDVENLNHNGDGEWLRQSKRRLQARAPGRRPRGEDPHPSSIALRCDAWHLPPFSPFCWAPNYR